MNIEPEKYGRIVCAALFHNNCIYMGRAHAVIFPMEPIGVLRCAPQGFVTENGFFVNREVGLYIAKYYNQIDKKHRPLDELMSEDLKKENIKILKYIKSYTYKERKEL